MITTNVELLTRELIAEVMPIIKRNHGETGHFDELNIAWEQYLSLGPMFAAFVMRDDDKVIGILFFVVSTYPHNFNWLMAQQVTFYVEPEYRRRSLGLMTFSENYLKEHHVDIIIQSARYDSSFCKVLEHRGYEPLDVTYYRSLK